MGASRWLEASTLIGPTSETGRAAIASKAKARVAMVLLIFIMHLIS
jgi:hypothetical protein